MAKTPQAVAGAQRLERGPTATPTAYLFLFWFSVPNQISYASWMPPRPFAIELTPDEAALAAAIQFDPHDTLGDTKAFHTNGDLVVQLTESLLARRAIPDQRLSYFCDPEFNIGGRGNSRQEQFMRNVRDHDTMLRHGHFLKYLRYFIYGPNLPEPVMQTFSQAVEECGSITSGDIAPLAAKARTLVRTYRLGTKGVADEFYKLCIDLGMDASDAASIRATVLQVRSTI